MRDIDTLLPMPGEKLPCIIDRHNLTIGKYYTIDAVWYEYRTAFQISIIDDNGLPQYVDLRFFNFTDSEV